jgi:hypothetical protein
MDQVLLELERLVKVMLGALGKAGLLLLTGLVAAVAVLVLLVLLQAAIQLLGTVGLVLRLALLELAYIMRAVAAAVLHQGRRVLGVMEVVDKVVLGIQAKLKHHKRARRILVAVLVGKL